MVKRIFVSALMVAACSGMLWSASLAAPVPAPQAASGGSALLPPIVTARPVIYVVGDGNDPNNAGVVIGVSHELNKFIAEHSGSNWNNAWVLPEPSLNPEQVAGMCPASTSSGGSTGPNRMVGFIVVSFTSTITDRFYILVSHDATHLYPYVEMVTCPEPSEAPIQAPTVVAAISQLTGAHGEAWVISQNEVSIPLASYAGVAALFAHKVSTTATDTIIVAAVSSATNYSIPGFSLGRRLQHASQHLADDVLDELSTYWCPQIRQSTTTGVTPDGTEMCNILAPTGATIPPLGP
ncbi:MAG TPA: hypothetical protein VEJ20_10150 [Candidatus Eremiobacteraceae bacterium]|nr:hypothetical protein [Candidatus Eremiobacteraceae bacterium]